jgi:3'-phosphoadenosine 5'-phosphosulfate (PAPS) 3'-phosphatase
MRARACADTRGSGEIHKIITARLENRVPEEKKAAVVEEEEEEEEEEKENREREPSFH